jgi:hypothetical protein
MVLKNQKLMLIDFVKMANKILDLNKGQEIKLTWYDIGVGCYSVDLEHNGVRFEDIKEMNVVVMYVYGYSNAISDDAMNKILNIWKNLVKFDDIVGKRL